MKTITVEHTTDTAHRLTFHKGKCNNLHGHTYRFLISIDVKEGFYDFYDLKVHVKETLNELFDHSVLLCNNAENGALITILKAQSLKVQTFKDEPTVENMVDWVIKAFEQKYCDFPLHAITIYETPTNYCTWTKEDKCKCPN